MKSDEAIKQIAYLKELTQKTRLKAAEGYPWLILWGIIYIIGYIGSVYIQHYLFWLILLIAGGILSAVIPQVMKKIYKSDNRKTPTLLKKMGFQAVMLLIAGGFIFSVMIENKNMSVVNAFWPFYVGVVYIVIGVHMGWDMVLIGFWIALVSVISVFIPLPYQHIWLAVTAGGGLLFTGILFRHQIKRINKQ